MEGARQVTAAVRWNFLGFFKNPRVIITFLFSFILCFFLSDRAMMVADYYDSSMQALEPFIWTFGDADSILLCSLLLILLFLDLPKLSPFTPYMLLRMKKSRWLLAQFFYIFLVTVLYMTYVLLVTGILCMQKTYPGNIWSKTAALLAYSGMGRDLSVPSTVKVMESTTPVSCSFQIMVLLICYALTLSFLMLLFQMKSGRKAAIGAGLFYSLFGFLLNPDILAKILRKEEYEMFLVRRITGWVSPLNHATYGMHDFGYDVLPSIGQSCMIFLVLLLFLSFLSFYTLKKYNFSSFTGD
ncbi:hypothetical protein C805_03533 [Eubacterium sp. 14-2]|uniref:hypothetical protein n=1 Tax=Eubacterium sp. 14-2 TaxID=1235790 RepID=UPI000336B6CE|nr:hypothetical protein [Eubacterium sp. 14-2]EOT22681.1 hypothetical protein C805_03533 [Eubacterium sp. 14-2]